MEARCVAQGPNAPPARNAAQESAHETDAIGSSSDRTSDETPLATSRAASTGHQPDGDTTGTLDGGVESCVGSRAREAMTAQRDLGIAEIVIWEGRALRAEAKLAANTAAQGPHQKGNEDMETRGAPLSPEDAPLGSTAPSNGASPPNEATCIRCGERYGLHFSEWCADRQGQFQRGYIPPVCVSRRPSTDEFSVRLTADNRSALLSRQQALRLADDILDLSETAAAAQGGDTQRATADVCGGCGGAYRFDTSVPSVLWNRVIRPLGGSEYLCTACIVRAFAKAGVSFTAELWGEDFGGLPIGVDINGAALTVVRELNEENTSMRAELQRTTEEIAAFIENMADVFGNAGGFLHGRAIAAAIRTRAAGAAAQPSPASPSPGPVGTPDA